MAIIIIYVVVITITVIIMKKYRERMRKQEVDMKPPDFDPDSHDGKLLPVCPLQADLPA